MIPILWPTSSRASRRPTEPSWPSCSNRSGEAGDDASLPRSVRRERRHARQARDLPGRSIPAAGTEPVAGPRRAVSFGPPVPAAVAVAPARATQPGPAPYVAPATAAPANVIVDGTFDRPLLSQGVIHYTPHPSAWTWQDNGNGATCGIYNSAGFLKSGPLGGTTGDIIQSFTVPTSGDYTLTFTSAPIGTASPASVVATIYSAGNDGLKFQGTYGGQYDYNGFTGTLRVSGLLANQTYMLDFTYDDSTKYNYAILQSIDNVSLVRSA